jgi:hypothetical protein
MTFASISQFSAAPSAIGYLYQFRLALLLIVRKAESAIDVDKLGVSIELDDDIALTQGDLPTTLVQSKSHLDTQKHITDGHPDIWKTIRVWAHPAKLSGDSVDLTRCLFITTQAQDESAASFLQEGDDRDIDKAIAALNAAAAKSDSVNLKPAIDSWQNLTPMQKRSLVNSIYVMDGSPDAAQIAQELGRLLFRHKAPTDQQKMLQLLEGWWIDRVTAHLYAIARERREDVIRWSEVRLQIDQVMSQFGIDALPNDFGSADPDVPINPSSDSRCFVHQMRLIGVTHERMRFAIRDHWRAREQRSKWIRDMRLLPEELRRYDQLLGEEWERVADDHCSGVDANDVSAARAASVKVFREIEKRQIQLRTFSEIFLTRGSYHILSDFPPKLGWHPSWKVECDLWASKITEINESAA